MLNNIDIYFAVFYTLFETNDLNKYIKEVDYMANYTEEQWNAKKVELMPTPHKEVI